MMAMRRFVVILLSWSSAAAAQSAVPASPPIASAAVTQPGAALDAPRAEFDDGVRLAPGDVLRVTVWRRPEMSGDSVVGDDGTLSHPLYRAIVVAGVPMATVESRMRSFLLRFNDDPQFTIEPMVRISITGEVRNANVYTLSPRTSIGQAVEMAGGVTERGRRNDVQLVRGGKAYAIDLSRADAVTSLGAVRSGDQILVPRHHDFFREYLAPGAAVTAAVAAVVNATRARRP
jgi:protein involved in polysaccharide export with SLBB domain